MAEYIEREELYRRVKEKTNPYGKPTLDYESGVKVLHMIDRQPAADVVEIEVIKEWLYEMASNNVGCVLDGDFADYCEKIISRLDGLRIFASERMET